MTEQTPGVARTPRSEAVIQDLIAQAIDYSAAADKARHDPALENAHTAALQATVKALAIVQGVSEAEANDQFIAALPD